MHNRERKEAQRQSDASDDTAMKEMASITSHGLGGALDGALNGYVNKSVR